jgi:putative Mg2+ transporter-C (MgtC) family protein
LEWRIVAGIRALSQVAGYNFNEEDAMPLYPEILTKIILAILLGGLIGGEREARDKSAGFRTIIMICVGATLFTMLSSLLSAGNDPARIAANIVTGIGFLGAGAIVRDGSRITGLTTASTIWLAAAVGMAVGGGAYLLAIVVTLLALLVLWVFPALEQKIDNLRHISEYQVVCTCDLEIARQLEDAFTRHGLKLYSVKRIKKDGKLNLILQVTGKPEAHEALVESLLKHDSVLELSY